MNKKTKLNIVETATASIGIAAIGWLSIPLVASAAGVYVTTEQAMKMSAIFFALRFGWLFFLRTLFDRAEK